MYHIIAVDDEIKALERFNRLLAKEPRVSALMPFTNPEEAIEYCMKNKPDIAFLDIDMPKIQGLRLAGMLREFNPFIDIVFVTAHDQYALDALHVHAYDYLLKPIAISDMTELFDQLDLRNKHKPGITPGKKLYVQCFGSFMCCTNQDKSSRIRFRTSKTEELFALLIQYNGLAASKEQLINKLWPDTDPEKASNYFRVTCTYLRKALEKEGFADIILRDRDSYLLDIDRLDCDMHRFLSKVKSGKLSPVDYSALEEAADLYAASYFEDRIYEWAFKYSIWLENEYKYIQKILTDEYIRQEQYDKACDSMRKLLLHDQFDEEIVIRLITTLLRLGDTTSAMITYNKYKENLWKELHLFPSEELRKLLV